MNHKNYEQIEIPVIKKLYELYEITHSVIMKFPKHEKYSLGEKLECVILDSLELIIFGNYQPKNFKEGYILKANAKIEILKILFRLAFSIKALDDPSYLKAQQTLQEIGKMLGGWLKYLKSK